MTNHKWKKLTENEYGTKPHECVKCDCLKMWVGGDMKCWEYWIMATDYYGKKTGHLELDSKFERPKCK